MKVRARVLACLSLAFLALALAPAPALAATQGPECGHANLDNPGNHYGLIKNGCLVQPPPPQPPPTQAPPPSQPPTPAAHPPPASNPVSGGVTRTLHAGAPDASGANANSQPSIDIASPAPLDLTAPGSLGHAAATLPPTRNHSWDSIWMLEWALLLLLLAALAVLAYLRRRQRAAATSAR